MTMREWNNLKHANIYVYDSVAHTDFTHITDIMTQPQWLCEYMCFICYIWYEWKCIWWWSVSGGRGIPSRCGARASETARPRLIEYRPLVYWTTRRGWASMASSFWARGLQIEYRVTFFKTLLLVLCLNCIFLVIYLILIKNL